MANFIRLFWTPNIYHWERCLNVAFVYVNGLNLVKFEEWYKFQGLVGNDAVYRHLQVLFRSFEIDITNLTHGMSEIIDTNTLMEIFAGMFMKY